MTGYFDHAATAPLRPEAAAAMLPWLTEQYGNPSGSHAVARAARTAVDEAREVFGELLGVPPGGVVFTSGGTESDNLAVLGAVAARPGAVVTTPVEHEAVLGAARLAPGGVRMLAVDGDGVVDLQALDEVLDPSVSVVSVQLVNNETGVVQPVAAVARGVRRRAPGAVVHTDAVQAFGWLDLRGLPADLVSLSAHKWGGPQGVGVLAVADGVSIRAISGGGGQERERRPGTHNVAGIVGAAAAAAAAAAGREAAAARIGRLRDRLVADLVGSIPGCRQTAAGRDKAPGHAHLVIDGVESEALLVLLDDAGICASAGSACASGAMEPSHVLLAMGLGPDEALGSLRLTLGPTTTDADVDLASKAVPDAVARLRGAR